jgi:hypothetical protein
MAVKSFCALVTGANFIKNYMGNLPTRHKLLRFGNTARELAFNRQCSLCCKAVSCTCKMFMKLTTGANIVKLFMDIIY